MAKKRSVPDQAAQSQTRATWIASIVAAVALVVSVLSLIESHEARLAALRDELSVQARRLRSDQAITIRKSEGALHHGAVTAPWEVQISNVGNSTVSVTSYEVQQLSDSGGEVLYSGLDRGLLSPETNEAVHLPFALESGRSIRLRLDIGINPGAKAYKILAAAIGDRQTKMPVDKTEKMLAKNGFDIYDNPVTVFSTNDGNLSGWQVVFPTNEQVFLIHFRTARGAEVRELASWYGSKRF